MVTKKKYFLKLILIYGVVALIYSIVAFCIFYFKSYELSQTELSNNMHSYLKQAKDSIDTKLMISINLANRLKDEQEVRTYIQSPNINYFNIANIYRELAKDAAAFSSAGYSVGISKITDNMVITPNYSGSLKDHFAHVGVDNFDTKKALDLLNQPKQTNAYFSLNSSANIGLSSATKNYLTLVKRDYLEFKEPYFYFFTFDQDALLPKYDPKLDTSFIIMRNTQTLCSQSKLEQAELNKILAPKIVQNMLASPTAKQENKSYYLLSEKSQVLDWVYVYMYPVNNESMSFNIVFGSIAICLGLFVFGILIAYPFIKGAYMPIKSIVDVFNTSKKENITDEISYIKKSAIEIRDTNENLRQIIKTQKRPLKTKFLRDIVLGLNNYDSTDSSITQFDLDFMKGNCFIVLIELSNQNSLEELYDEGAIQTIEHQVMEVIRNKTNEYYRHETFQLDYKRLVMIINHDNTQEIRKYLQTILLDIEKDYDLMYTAVISKPCSSIDQINKTYRQTSNIFEAQSKFTNNTVVSVDDIILNENETYYYPLNDEKVIIDYITIEKSDKALKILNDILEENLDKRTLNKELISQFVFSITSTINRILYLTNNKIEDIFSEGTVILLELKMCHNTAQLKEKIMDIFMNILTKLHSDQQVSDGPVAEDMLSYIHENYAKDISLWDLAQHFNLSQCYASTLFKKHTGHNFKDYLNIYRINESKRILRENPYIKIKELAELVGCNSSNSFIRMFIRYEGISPKQYTKTL